MRLGVNASILGSAPTGLGLYTAHLVRELAGLVPDLVVYTSAPAAIADQDSGVRAITPAVQPEHGMAGHATRMVWLQTVLRARIRLDRIDFLLNTVPEAPVPPVVPQVTVVHDLLPLRYPAEYPRQQHFFRMLVPRALRASRLVIAVSESTRRDIMEAYGLAGDRIRVVAAGYSEEVFHPAPVESASGDGLPYVLFVGNLLPHKNLLRLLDAFVLLSRRTRCRLLIRGEGHPRYVRELRGQLATLPCRDLVRFVPYASPRQLADLYRGAACLVLPSLYEGFGLTALEAMACGTPVVASSSSSIPEVVGDAARLVDPMDAIEIATALHEVLTGADLREDLVRRGLERARRFSWRGTALGVQAVLEEAAGRALGPTG